MKKEHMPFWKRANIVHVKSVKSKDLHTQLKEIIEMTRIESEKDGRII